MGGLFAYMIFGTLGLCLLILLIALAFWPLRSMSDNKRTVKMFFGILAFTIALAIYVHFRGTDALPIAMGIIVVLGIILGPACGAAWLAITARRIDNVLTRYGGDD